jgi:hypothetical protein
MRGTPGFSEHLRTKRLRELIIAMCQGVMAEGSRALAIKRPHCSGNEEDKLEQLRENDYLPAEKYPYLLLRFYDTYICYIYIKNLVALCSGSPAPISIIYMNDS